MGTLQRLQEGLKRLWTNELYSEKFNASPLKHRDFDHALKHVRKAAQALENMTEECDHVEMELDPAAVRKYAADIVISAIRLANVCPSGAFDIESAVFERIKRKMGEDLEDDRVPVKGVCKGCGHAVPNGYYECGGSGSHVATCIGPAR